MPLHWGFWVKVINKEERKMKLDEIQEYIKEKYGDEDVNRMNTIWLFLGLRELNVKFPQEYLEINEKIQLKLDMSDFIDEIIGFGINPYIIDAEKIIHHTFKEYIIEILGQVEDIEAVNEMEPEDCMDICDRDRELNQC